jgi:hypothetical protein
MNNRLQQQQSEQAAQDLSQSASSTQRTFNTAEEVIQADRAQTPVPPNVSDRIAETIAHDPNPPPSTPRPWWRRLFGH